MVNRPRGGGRRGLGRRPGHHPDRRGLGGSGGVAGKRARGTRGVGVGFGDGHRAVRRIVGRVGTGADGPGCSGGIRPQVSLGEAAGGGSDPSTAAPVPVVDKWLDPGAAAVNDGTKKQAAGVVLLPAPVVDPSQVLPDGLVNGCVSGYGQGVQCLPTTPPSHAGHGSGQDMSIYWTCAEARTLLPDGITVDTPGADPLGLDSNKDGTACGAGDR